MSESPFNYSDYLQTLGLEAFNEMQQEFFGKASGSDQLILLAPTGSGKTLAYLLPLIQMLDLNKSVVQALVIVPSRELALQIEQVFKSLKTSFKVTTCYGGHSMKTEQNALLDAPAVIIATPGRLSEHVDNGSFDPSTVRLVVLDEFDKSLQFGFHEQLKVIFEKLPGDQRHFLTSATQLSRLPEFLPFRSVVEVDYLKDAQDSKLKLNIVRTTSVEKVETLMRLIAGFGHEVCLVFCNHRDAVDRISALLSSNHFEHAVLHGGMEQIDREKNLIKFRNGTHHVLIATDLASRGLDIPEIKHVVHYQLPPKEDAFIHRNGRTARMHASGQSYLVQANDEELPEYIRGPIVELELPEEITLPEPSPWACLYISAGKKDKIGRGDVVGMLTKKGGLIPEQIGLITIMDTATYVAIDRKQMPILLEKVSQERIKKVKVRMAEAN
ncbi:DEAD/DEAH box helicase [Lunatibacter salilacus]|uniref:DEAD/DEAH box helicase n=1 Tax=Lunatibacter salilacus TaxID=2483804 RepID=UPI00131DEC71|nr:DEAD/DEAH box helicase [Lunatibacter salilacus]